MHGRPPVEPSECVDNLPALVVVSQAHLGEELDEAFSVTLSLLIKARSGYCLKLATSYDMWRCLRTALAVDDSRELVV